MKKLIALLLALTMLLSLAACGKKTAAEEPEKEEPEFEESSDEKSLLWDEEEKEDTKDSDEEQAKEEPAEDAEEETAVEETPAEETPAEETPAEEPAAEEPEGASLGQYENGAYWNDDLGYGCNLDDSWVVFDEEQIAQLNQFAIEAYDDEAIREQLSNVNMFYDMAAQNTTGTGMIQVMVENLGLVYGYILTEEQYIEITLKNLEAQLPAAGYTNIDAKMVTVEFAGEECPAVSVYGEINGIAVYQLMVPIKVGNQIAVYAVASYVEDHNEEYLRYFYALN